MLVNGIGWINRKEFGSVYRNEKETYARDKIPKDRVFSMPFKNFGRLDAVSIMTCAAVAMALRDANITYSENSKADIGIITTGKTGSYHTDLEYFRDYLESGRTLSRGNLFIYTLPSSPAGEAAIHFGLQGPLFYMARADSSAESVFETAVDMITSKQASAMLAGISDDDNAVYFVLAVSGRSLCDHKEALKIINSGYDFDNMISEFANLRKGTITR